MFRTFACTVVAVALATAAVLAAEYKGKATKLDLDGKKITITVDGKEKTFSLTADTKFLQGDKEMKEKGLKKRAEALSTNPANVTVVTEGTGDSEKVKTVTFMGKKK